MTRRQNEEGERVRKVRQKEEWDRKRRLKDRVGRQYKKRKTGRGGRKEEGGGRMRRDTCIPPHPASCTTRRGIATIGRQA
jgi:hypothetical protein